jgi:hypothetical protein
MIRTSWKTIIENELKQELGLFREQGYKPTLRAVYYRLYSRGLFPNTKNTYQSLDRATVEARWSGRLRIDCFADNARQVIGDFNDAYQSPEAYLQHVIDFIKAAPEAYMSSIPRWHNQPHYVEVWIEKDAMAGTLQSILRDRHVRIVPNRGFTSLTALYANSSRLEKFQHRGKQIHVLYFGDFDPSGDDMDRDLKKRLSRLGWTSNTLDFRRIAVTTEQIQRYDLPFNPDKTTLEKMENDSRRHRFSEKYGGLYAVELDALPARIPEDFKNMVLQSVDQFFDEDIFAQVLAQHSSTIVRDIMSRKVRLLDEQ